MGETLGRWRATYTPGSWLLLCGPAAAVVLEPADPSWSDLVETLWDEVVAADSIADVAARLAWYRIDTMPSFAAFFWGPDGMRSLVRGALSVVDAETGDVVASGEGVQTWVETGLGALRQVRVELPAQRPAGAFPLPLVVGVVGVSTVFLDATDEAALSSPQLGVRDAAGPEQADGGEDVGADPDAVPDDVTSRTDQHEDAETRWVPMPELLEEQDATREAGPGRSERSEPAHPAVLCSWGHPNPPRAPRCRVCDGLIPAQPTRAVPTPVLAVLRASNGETADLLGSVLVGRAPSPERARAETAALLTVTSPSHDISRTHVEVFASGWDVCVTDLHSTNGTVLVGPDRSIRTMGSGETATVPLGTSLELADGISVLIDFPQ